MLACVLAKVITTLATTSISYADTELFVEPGTTVNLEEIRQAEDFGCTAVSIEPHLHGFFVPASMGRALKTSVNVIQSTSKVVILQTFCM